jgi:L-fuconolactonase
MVASPSRFWHIRSNPLTMRIDAHQHFWIYDPSEYAWIDESMANLRRDFLPDDLKPELDQAGVHGCVAVQARQTLEETNWLLRLASESPFILGVVGWVDLRSAKLRSDLQGFANQPKLVGVRHIVQSEPDERFLLQPEFLRGLSMLEAYDLAYDILIYEKHLPVAAEFVQQFPRQRFVLDHLGKPRVKEKQTHPWSEGIRKLAAFPNVYCKLSGMVTEADWQNWKPDDFAPYLDVAVECFGPDRVMFGSDWPVCTVAGSYLRVMDAIHDYFARFAGNFREKLLGSNAIRFYKLQSPGG